MFKRHHVAYFLYWLHKKRLINLFYLSNNVLITLCSLMLFVVHNLSLWRCWIRFYCLLLVEFGKWWSSGDISIERKHLVDKLYTLRNIRAFFLKQTYWGLLWTMSRLHHSVCKKDTFFSIHALFLYFCGRHFIYLF